MNSYVFPGQGSQFPGMGKDLFEQNAEVKAMFLKANDILGFNITDVMFNGSEDDLKQTKVTQPAVFLLSVAMAKAMGNDFKPDMVAGHSLGEFSAVTAAGAISFEAGLSLVAKRAAAMQKACESTQGTMAAVLGGSDELVEEACKQANEIAVVVPANYNSPGQVVISGEKPAIDKVAEILKDKVKGVLPLKVGGAFHSPLMESARAELAQAIEATEFHKPNCPVYQNVDAKPHTDPAEIKANLLTQLTSPVRWTQSVQNMIKDGATEFKELGPGQVLTKLIKRIQK
ncbi:MAG: ACP S-malonyltransferase [Fibrobacter sp.]|uniref:ACP S-malonyltransferase n=1 Tax=Fibrobacter sp. UWP2 TaxID=1896216 RepID=UPI00091D8FED|nr:ACP S-malonyltransferase [Fibrobacter sp. UWP2]MCR5377888.1 ACP S-malonyltransferase [Fibrobacter sp.]SHJ08308.1 [Acyl-carrier-protein] S-malonyltransferase [Fibrobacter sp. UWP2]